MKEAKKVVVLLKTGKSDNGKNATLAFSCALSAVALGHDTTMFLTSDGAVWGYTESAAGISVQGFSPLQTLIEEFIETGGQIMLCSVCHRTCSIGGPDSTPLVQKLGAVQIAGFTSMVELAADGVCISF